MNCSMSRILRCNLRLRKYLFDSDDGFLHSEIDNMSLSFRIQKPSGLVVYGLSTIHSGEKIRGCRGETVCVDFTLPCFLQAGYHLLGGGVAEMVADAQFNVLHIVRGAVQFEVCGQIQFQGVADLQSEVKQNLLSTRS